MNEVVPFFQASGGIGGWALAIALVTTAIKVWPKLKELQVGSDGSLRQDLMAEIVRLRADNTEERTQCDKRMDELAKEHRTQLSELEKQIRELQSEIRQIVASQARAMNSHISEQLGHIFPAHDDMPKDIKEVLFKLDGPIADAG